jgi:hypothetical protein
MKLKARIRRVGSRDLKSSFRKTLGLRTSVINIVISGVILLATALFSDIARIIDKSQSVSNIPIERVNAPDEIIRKHVASSYVNEFYARFLKSKSEPALVVAVKREFPGLIDEFQLSSYADLKEIFGILGLEKDLLDVQVYIVSHGLLEPNFSCVQDECQFDTEWKLSDQEAERTTKLIFSDVLPALISGSYSSHQIKDWVDKLLPSVQKMDYAFLYPDASVTRRQSIIFLVLAFLDSGRGNYSEDLLVDLKLLFNYGLGERVDFAIIGNSVLREYMTGVKHYYENCFLESASSMRSVRRLTSNYYINAASHLMELRALSRPFMSYMKPDFIILFDDVPFVQDACDGNISASKFFELFQIANDARKAVVSFAPFVDDYDYLESVMAQQKSAYVTLSADDTVRND